MPLTPAGHEPDDDFALQDDWDSTGDADDGVELDDPATADADDDESDSQTVPCPQCGRSVYEDADYCPACGAAIVSGARAPGGRAWIVAGMLILALLAGAFVYL